MFASNMYQSSHTALTFLFPIILNNHFLLNNDICHFVQRDGTERYFFLLFYFVTVKWNHPVLGVSYK